MEKAYIILVHRCGKHLYRLLTRLNDGNSFFFIHVDKKVALDEFAFALRDFSNKIKLTKRVAIEWGGFSLVEATLQAMREVKNHPTTFSWVSLLSGQDYPIKTNEYINKFFSTTSHHAFFDYTTLPDYERWSPRGGYYRIDKYYMGLKKVPKLTAKALNLLSNFFPFVRRPTLGSLTPYAGSQWWTIDATILNYILNYVKNNPRYSAFHKYTFAADEVFFHTIVLNADELKLKVQNNNKRFFIWLDTSKSHPETLQAEDLDAIKNSDGLFARKFDLEQYPEILNLVDSECLS